MKKENQAYNIQPAERLQSVSEYYFSRKLKEVAQMNAEGKDVISLGIGSPDMPPSEAAIKVLCEQAQRADVHGYQPTVGIPELRQAMSDFDELCRDMKTFNINLAQDDEFRKVSQGICDMLKK